MSLDTGRRIHRYSLDVLPIGDDVIRRVNKIGKSEDQPMVVDNFKYQWDHDGKNIEYDTESDDEEEYIHDHVILPPPNMLITNEDLAEALDEEENEYIEGLEEEEEAGGGRGSRSIGGE